MRSAVRAGIGVAAGLEADHANDTRLRQRQPHNGAFNELGEAMEIQRRIFIGTMGLGALAGSLDAQAEEPSKASEKWDLSWVAQVSGKLRAVFDSPQFGGGGALMRAIVWKREYKEVYGTAPEDMSAVLVLRHEGIWLAMNDVFWKNYNVGEAQNLKHQSGKVFATNPVSSTPPEAPPDFAGTDIPHFLSTGNIVLVCHLAFGDVVDLVKATDKIATDEEAEKKAMTFLLPGVIMQPSGVFAVLRAQEAGCHYILAS